MKNKNTIAKGTYIIDHIFWTLISLVWFNNSLFRCIEGWTYSDSRLFLWFSLAISMVSGMLLTWKKRRNKLSLLVNILLPYEFYSLVVLYIEKRRRFWYLLFV